jgi:NAD-dependent SIR2 family protein deacetylase
MLSYGEVLILTGAGVSAPSGIPTFRGTSGLYSKKF